MIALASGALYWPDEKTLCVSDLHLGKSERIARRSGGLLPPYEIRATLDQLEQDLDHISPRRVICLGDSFDDLAAANALNPDDISRLLRLQAGREWIWIEGNHDPGPVALGGTHLCEWTHGPLTFRHIADPNKSHEISGHYHPKASRPAAYGSRPCFVVDAQRMILPAYGAFTGGLRCQDAVLQDLFPSKTIAILTGSTPLVIPFPRPNQSRGANRFTRTKVSR